MSGTIPTCICLDIEWDLNWPNNQQWKRKLYKSDSMNAQMHRNRETATVRLHLRITEYPSGQYFKSRICKVQRDKLCMHSASFLIWRHYSESTNTCLLGYSLFTSSIGFILFLFTGFISDLESSKETLGSCFTSLKPENASIHGLDNKNKNTKHTSERKRVDYNSPDMTKSGKY